MIEITANKISRERVTIEMSPTEIKHLMEKHVDLDMLINEVKRRLIKKIEAECLEIHFNAWKKANPTKNPSSDYLGPTYGSVNESKGIIVCHQRYGLEKSIEVPLTHSQLLAFESIKMLKETLEPKP